MLKSVPETIEY